MSKASTGIENSEPDIQAPLLENVSVETLSSDAKNESGVDINQVEKTCPPIIEREIPIATPVETRKNELDLPEESRFEKFLICVAFLVAIAAAYGPSFYKQIKWKAFALMFCFSVSHENS